MNDANTYQTALASMKAWLKRKVESGYNPTGDEEWSRIRTGWPSLSENDAERVYQELGAYRARAGHKWTGAFTFAAKQEG